MTEASAIIKYDGAENIVPVVVPKDAQTNKESNTRTPEHTEVSQIENVIFITILKEN